LYQSYEQSFEFKQGRFLHGVVREHPYCLIFYFYKIVAISFSVGSPMHENEVQEVVVVVVVVDCISIWLRESIRV